jgi:hypothetical protein
MIRSMHGTGTRFPTRSAARHPVMTYTLAGVCSLIFLRFSVSIVGYAAMLCYAVAWLTLQWLAARGDSEGPGVAYLAHVVGFTLGFLSAWLRFRTPRSSRVSGPAPAATGRTPTKGSHHDHLDRAHQVQHRSHP